MGPPSTPDPHLLAYVAGRDVECPVCKYNLRDLPSDRCPECGQSLMLRLAQVEPRLRLWLAMLVPLLLGGGLGSLFLVLCIKWGLPRVGAVPVLLFGLMFPVGLVALRSRRWFLRRTSLTQWSLVAASIVANVVLFTWTMISVR